MRKTARLSKYSESTGEHSKLMRDEFDGEDVQLLLRVLRDARDDALTYERHAINRMIDFLEKP